MRANPLISYPLGAAGMDQRTDPKMLPLGRPRLIENMRFTKNFSLARRDGWGLVSSGVPSTFGSLIGVRNKLIGVRNDGEAGAICSRSWSELLDETISAGTAPFDLLDTGSKIVFAVTSAAGGFTRVVVIDKTTRQQVSFTSVAVNTFNVRLMLVGSTVLMGHSTATTLVIHTVDLSTAVYTATATITGTNSDNAWDWATGGGSSFLGVVVRSSAANDVLVRTFTSGFAVSSSATLTLAGAATALGCCFATSNTFVVVTADATTGLRRIAYSYALAITWAIATVDAGVQTREAITCAYDGVANVNIYVQESQTPVQTYNRSVARYTTTSGGSAGPTRIRGVYLAGKIAHYNHVPVGYDSPLQRSYFLMDSALTIQARWHYGLSAPVPTGKTRPAVYALGTGYGFGGSVQVTNAINPTFVLAAMRFTFDTSAGLVVSDSASDSVVSGGILRRSRVASAALQRGGHWIAPGMISIASSSAGGSVSASSTYSVLAVYERTDASGQVVESAPSTPLTITTGAADNRITVTIQVHRLDLTLSEQIVIYRTTAGGTVYYRETAVAEPATSDSRTENLTASDATLQANASLYTSGGVLDNYTPSSVVAIASSGRRVLVVQGDDPTRVYQSKLTDRGNQIMFAQELYRTVSVGSSPLTALAYLDGRWFAFTDKEIFVASGDGADDTGANDSLSEFTEFSRKVGCEQQSLCIQTPFGVIFRSATRGLWMIGRDGSLSNIGAPVEDELSGSIGSMVFDSDKSCVYVLNTATDRMLVLALFDTETGTDYRWSVDTRAVFNSLAICGGVLYASVNDGVSNGIYSPTPGVYFDQHIEDDPRVNCRILTGWIQIGQGKQGLGRLRRISVLGRIFGSGSNGSAEINTTRDYSDSLTLDSDGRSHSQAVTGGTAYQWEQRPSVQKLQSIGIALSETPSDECGWEVTEIQLEVLPLGGATRLEGGSDGKVAV